MKKRILILILILCLFISGCESAAPSASVKQIEREWRFGEYIFSSSMELSDSVYSGYLKKKHAAKKNEDYYGFLDCIEGDTAVKDFVESFRADLAEGKALKGRVSDAGEVEYNPGFGSSRFIDADDPGFVFDALLPYVQDLEYVDDIDWTNGKESEYIKYPYETLYDQCGDCEDKAILMAAIAKELGLECCLLHLDAHMALGLVRDDISYGYHYTYEGKSYYYVETNNPGWAVGGMPDQYKDCSSATMYFIN